MAFAAQASVVSVNRDDRHRFSKAAVPRIMLLEGLGVEGDAHAGVTVQHRSRVRADPTAPNLRQVHLIQSELFDDLRAAGYDVAPGQLGENITTTGIDLLALPRGAVLRIGADAAIEVTGLRNPCAQINSFSAGLLKQVLDKDEEGALVRRAGIMGIVLAGGAIAPGDPLVVTLPDGPPLPLERV